MSPIKVDVKFRPLHAKLVIPAAGVLAGYVGAFVMARLVLDVFESRWSSSIVIWLGFCLAGLLAMIPADKALGESAAHVDLLRVPAYWTGAALLLLFLHWLFASVFATAIHPFFDNLALWGAGALAIWLDEPGAPSWLKRPAARKGPPPS